MKLKGNSMNIVCTLSDVNNRRASLAASLLSFAAGICISGPAAAQDTPLGSRVALPVIEWSVQPPMSAERRSDEPLRDMRLRDAGAPVLTDPVAPTERLLQARMNDAFREPITAPQDLPADRSRLVLTLRATPTSRASMVVEQATSARTANSWRAAQAAEAPTTRVGLELRSASAEKRLGINNVLKVQLSGGSTLLFKPRRSGVAVTWRSEF